ncbi:MAG: hypothetical protein U5J63_17740 [Fodinibius sp.]|nr:hypothetical protein [Fodinibius sp.]
MESSQSLSKLTPDATIEQIVAANNKAGELLASIGLPVSDHENETLRSVCQQQQWSETEVLNWVKKHSRNTNDETANNSTQLSSPDSADLAEWTSYLHEHFISVNQPLLEELEASFPRVHKVHGNQYPWLKNMCWHFNKFSEALGMYYAFEIDKFFPLVEQIDTSETKSLNHGVVQKVEKSFSIIERDQDRLKRQINIMRDKGKDFENPHNACSTLRIQNENLLTLCSQLETQFELESDQLIPGIKKQLKETR